MFILRKIIDRGINVPETLKMKADSSESYKAGSALVLTDGVLKNCASNEKGEYIALENASGKDSLYCYKINADMLFEAPCSADTSSLKTGDAVTLYVEDGAALGVTASTAGGVATVVEKSEGNILTIRF